MSEDIRDFADAALSDPGTTCSASGFALLAAMRKNSDGKESAAAFSRFLTEVAGLRAAQGSRVWLPHSAVKMMDALVAEGTGAALPPGARPGTIPGSWNHEGIEVGATVTLRLNHTVDHFRSPDAPLGVRVARCRVTKLGSDTTGTHPYVWFSDLDNLHEGQGSLSLDQFRACAGPASPGAAPKRR